MRRILTITLNPALDLASAADRVEAGPKLRCDEPRYDPGGGGVNVSRAISKLGRTSHAFVATGGATGEAFRALLDAEGQSASWFSIPHATRQSLTVFDRSANNQYRFILPGPPWDAATLARCKSDLRTEISNGDLVVFSGSLPPGVPSGFLTDIVRLSAEAGAEAVLDVSGEALEVVAQAANSELHVLRMDQREAGQLLGVTKPDVAQAESLARRLVETGATRIAVIALGARGGIAVSANESWRFVPPQVPVLSATGAGDSFVAGLVIGLASDWTLERCFTYATATAAAAVQTEATDLCRPDLVETALPGVVCTSL